MRAFEQVSGYGFLKSGSVHQIGDRSWLSHKRLTYQTFSRAFYFYLPKDKLPVIFLIWDLFFLRSSILVRLLFPHSAHISLLCLSSSPRLSRTGQATILLYQVPGNFLWGRSPFTTSSLSQAGHSLQYSEWICQWTRARQRAKYR